MADPRIQNANRATGMHVLLGCDVCRSGQAGTCQDLRALIDVAVAAEAEVLAEALQNTGGQRPELIVSHDGCLTLTANLAALAALYHASRAMLMDPDSLGTSQWRDAEPWLRVERLG